MNDENVRVSYGIKELLGRIDTRLESIDAKLDTKTDERDFQLLADRVSAQGNRMTAIEQRLKVFDDRVKQRGLAFSRREKYLALLIALLAVVIQALPFIHGGHL